MKEFIVSVLPYEIYLRILCGFITFIWILQKIWQLTQFLINKNMKSKKDDAIEIPQINNSLGIEDERNELDSISITQKLLQNIDAESSIVKDTPNRIEMMEKEGYIAEESNDLLKDQDKEKNKNTQDKSILQSPDIYKVKTNHEVVNKQRSQFEFLKNEIELLKSKSQWVDYEKKLIQASMDFPDDYYLNSSLGDWYMESEDFKKAQTLFKKLHLQNEDDDKVLYKLGIINLELGDLQSAEFLLTKAKDLKPENPRYYQVLAEVKYNLEKIDESIELMEKVVDLRPTKFDYIEILGKLYKESDNIQLYYKTLLKMNALEPLNQKVRGELSKFQE